jgi:arylsulfatase A-like enzyme
MMRFVCGFVALLALGSSVHAADAPRGPNVIVIMSDDMGFTDLGCYGGEIQTPNLDALAENGLRFTQFYNCARCCPTRASLLTGLYPHQAGVGHMMDDWNKPGYRGDLNKSCRLFGEVLKPAGYRAYAVGKWHVTRFASKDGPKDNWPLQRGFDRFYGTIHGAGSFYDPSSLVRDNTMISPYADPDYKPKTYYYTDAISDNVLKFLGDHDRDNKEKPFFMYVTYTAAHWPMHALPEDIAKYKGKYDGGYEPMRKARFEKAAKLGLIDPKQPMSPQAENWDKVADKKWEAACMEVYAAMVDRMDQGIGKIVAELKKNGQFDNTVIFFLQDNGGCAEPMGRTEQKNHPNILRPEKPTFPAMKPTDFAAPGSVPAQTRDGFPVRMGNKVMPGADDTYVAYGHGWANVSNTPFREYKHWVHEGGISTPLIVHWPKGNFEKGKLRDTPAHLIDIAATVYELAGAQYPKDSPPLEGMRLVRAFGGKPVDRPGIFWEHEGNRAMRDGDWKLVSKHNQPWELYDISKDRVEGTNLAAKMPEKVKELAAKYDDWAKRAQVEPWPVNPAKKKE